MAVPGVAGVTNLGKVVSELTQAFGGDAARAAKFLETPGVFKNLVEAGVITTAGVGAASAAPAVAAGGGGLLKALGIEAGAELLAGGAVSGLGALGTAALGTVKGAAAPTQYPVGEPTGRSKYFFSPEVGLSYQQYYESVIPRVRALNALSNKLGLGDVAEEPANPQQFAEFQTDLTEKQAENLTNRLIREIVAEKQFDYLARGLEAQATVERQKQQSLGEIQRQRVQSGYDAASSMLNKAIENVMAREKFENNTAIAELAKPI